MKPQNTKKDIRVTDLDEDLMPEIPAGAKLVPMQVVIDRLVARFNQRKALRNSQLNPDPVKDDPHE